MKWSSQVIYPGPIDEKFDGNLDALAIREGGQGALTKFSPETGQTTLAWVFLSREDAWRFRTAVQRVFATRKFKCDVVELPDDKGAPA